jgi:hypothetical protein
VNLDHASLLTTQRKVHRWRIDWYLQDGCFEGPNSIQQVIGYALCFLLGKKLLRGLPHIDGFPSVADGAIRI